MILSAKDIIKMYRRKTIVKDVSLEINQGEVVGLLGPNGAGKTTIFYTIAGLVKPTQGNVFLDTECITTLPIYKRGKKGIVYLPQEASIFRQLTVEENIMAILEMGELSKKEQNDKLNSLIKEFSLEKVRKNKGIVLSGGERRRTEIARALSTNPKFLLLDEPFAGVDPIAIKEIQNIIQMLKYKNIGVLITDHNVDETLAITDRSYLIFDGEVLKEGTPEELASDEKARALYLGDSFRLRRDS
jgi:lipopolysaccharide export system ATP-binding protein